MVSSSVGTGNWGDETNETQLRKVRKKDEDNENDRFVK